VTAVTVTAIRIAAHVHPAIVRYPLDAGIVAVTVIRPRRRGECDASAYTPPRPEASTAKMSSAPIASPPAAGPITSACPGEPPPPPQRPCLPRRNRQKRQPLGLARRRSTRFST